MTTVVPTKPSVGAALLDEIDAFLGQYVIYPSDAMRHAHVLWIAHTHLMECWESTPRIHFRSPEPSCGKSRALEVTEPLVPWPVHAVNVTSAYLFRKIDSPQGPPTILYDEIDTVFGPKAKEHEDIRAVLNSGHRKGATAGRCVVNGRNVKTIELQSYCAVAMAGVGGLPDTIESRCIIVRMKKRTSREKVRPWRLRIDFPKGREIGERLAGWADGVREKAANSWPEMPEGVEDRDADVWEALIAVADLAGGHWPKTARTAALAAVSDKADIEESDGMTLLRDIRNIFKDSNADQLCTAQLLLDLHKIEESPWKSYRRDGGPLNANGLGRLLKPYGIRSHNIRVDQSDYGGTRFASDKVLKGYARSDFTDAWGRYLD